MEEVELKGRDVLRWLKEVGHDAARTLILGCSLDNQVDDDLLVIEAIDPDFVLHCQLGSLSKRVPPALLSRSSVFDTKPGYPLRAAVESILSPAELQLAEAKDRLRGLGISPAKITRSADVYLLLSALEDHQSKRVPSAADQNEIYDAFKRSDLLVLGAKVIRGWLDVSLHKYGEVNAGILIKLAYCLRHSGQLDPALKATESVIRHDRHLSLSLGQKSVLATERAAILMDLFETRRDRQLLAQARRCAGISWAIGPSDETRLVYKRLEMHERTQN